MKKYLVWGVTFLALNSCSRDNVGPYDETFADFSLNNFDRLAMSNGLKVSVVQGNAYRIVAHGHRADVDDLDVRKVNDELRISYRHNRNRQYDMELEITMPYLESVDFSGAVEADITGFEQEPQVDVRLSGASELWFSGTVDFLSADLSGASELELEGYANQMDVILSGASELDAFEFPVYDAAVDLSGASKAEVTASQNLKVRAAGASALWYRGNPRMDVQSSGGSTVRRD
ncbi:head GIN domain-containing protein [Siphonobacter sp. SORGH_AS_1065]|uniref:head GIN domain-containing protein n=1 Tax=Siphonobacter sp. SORGH_AS_1065 TaxID=3041795 RepID=UPI00277D93C7|nr:head GIN domain-containing protein [Siphonobacter sp. SORGH_AS_1065]MDQ1088195.1 hypothetical protein [Siphonobacter sp. SORGH_AS_1065]